MTTLGKYELHELLGSGAYADVYKAVDTSLKCTVALKILKPALLADEEAFQRFIQEAQTAAGLFHPHIATVLDLGEADGRYFIAMRYVDGPSLDKLLKERGPLPWVDALRIMQQVGEALQFAHDRGLVHRDVKPQNIIVSPAEGAVLTDFGLVKAMQTSGMSTRSGVKIGTPAYMAPEIWEGKPATQAADQYALACVLVEMVSGKVLFDGPSDPAIMLKHFQPPELPADWPSGTPVGLDAVLRKALAQEAGKRYANIGEFMKLLKEVDSGLLLMTSQPVEINVQAPISALPPTKSETPLVLEGLPLPPAFELTPYQHLLRVKGGKPGKKYELSLSFAPTWLTLNNNYPDSTLSGIPPQGSSGMVRFRIIASGDASFAAALKVQRARHSRPSLRYIWGGLVLVAVIIIGVILLRYQLIGEDKSAAYLYNSIPTDTLTPVVTSTPPACDQIGQIWISPLDGMAMLCVPAGEFWMGSADSDPQAEEDEKPRHKVYLDAFWIDQNEVTVAQFRQFVSQASYSASAGGGEDDHPVDNVTWYDAQSYCKWAGEQLPTESQWEKAARGGLDGKLYPWGDETPICLKGASNGAQLNYCDPHGAAAVRSFAPNGYGLYDMAGNVREWVADWYDAGYYSSSPKSNPTGPTSGEAHVLRGGSWNYDAWGVRAAYRGRNYPDFRDNYIGFRCSR